MDEWKILLLMMGSLMIGFLAGLVLAAACMRTIRDDLNDAIDYRIDRDKRQQEENRPLPRMNNLTGELLKDGAP